MREYTPVCFSACLCVYLCIHVCVCLFVFICACVYMCFCVCMYVYVCVRAVTMPSNILNLQRFSNLYGVKMSFEGL